MARHPLDLTPTAHLGVYRNVSPGQRVISPLFGVLNNTFSPIYRGMFSFWGSASRKEVISMDIFIVLIEIATLLIQVMAYRRMSV